MRILRAWGLFLALVLTLPAIAAAEGTAPYVENEWNYVDGSMDISGGIPEDAEGALAMIREAGVLRVATEPYYPPQEFIDPSLSGQAQYVGADMELARRIAERMGVELEIVPMAFTQVLQAVAEGKCDLAISALAYIPSRAAMVELSKGYFFAEDVASRLLVRAELADDIHTVDDLGGRDIVAQSGSLQEAMMAERVREYRQFRRVASIQEVYDALESGAAEAAAVDVETAEVYLENHPDCGLELVEGVRFDLDAQFQGDRIAGKKGELQLMYFVNGVIDASVDDYRAWFETYGDYAARIGAKASD